MLLQLKELYFEVHLFVIYLVISALGMMPEDSVIGMNC